MLLVPPEIPVTTPLIESTTAIAVLLDVHFPPVEDVERVVVVPSQILSEPVKEEAAFTVTVAVVKQPAGKVYVIDDVPLDIPVTLPFDVPIVATDVFEELHVPPVIVLVKFVVAPIHVVFVPEIAAGDGLTVNTELTLQPVAVI